MHRQLLLFGALGGALFFSTIHILAAFLTDYSHVSMTVSEIGEIGSPVEVPFQLAMLTVNLCILLFALGLLEFARKNEISLAPAVLVAWFGLSDAGTNLFPSPHPLHNLFGLSMTVGYMAPVSMAIAWRRFDRVPSLRGTSVVVAMLTLISIFLNISPAFARDLYPIQYYGVVQRSAFVLFYSWVALVGALCWRDLAQRPGRPITYGHHQVAPDADGRRFDSPA